MVTQAAFAALGDIPGDVLALGVRIEESRVELVVQREQETDFDEDVIDVWEIRDQLGDLLGPDVQVSLNIQVRPTRLLNPNDPTRWFYVERIPG